MPSMKRDVPPITPESYELALDSARSCLKCMLCEMCFLRHAVSRVVEYTGKGLLSREIVEKIVTPGVADDLYIATANACKKFETDLRTECPQCKHKQFQGTIFCGHCGHQFEVVK